MQQNTMIGREGGRGRGGSGHRGGHGYRPGGRVIYSSAYGYPWGGYGYAAVAVPWWSNYAAFRGYPGYGTQACGASYAAWQQALRAGAAPAVTAQLKARFERCLYGT